MAWFDTLATVIQGMTPAATGTLLNQISGQNEMVAQINAMLLEVQRDPFRWELHGLDRCIIRKFGTWVDHDRILVVVARLAFRSAAT